MVNPENFDWHPTDQELADVISRMGADAFSSMTAENLAEKRAEYEPESIAEYCQENRVTVDEIIATPAGAPPIEITHLYASDSSAKKRPAIIYIHPGGTIFSDRYNGLSNVVRWCNMFDAHVFSIEYRLAPEHPAPAPLLDCWNAIAWLADNAAEFGFDADSLIVVGPSGGGLLATGIAVLAQNSEKINLRGLQLWYPMLNHHQNTASMAEFHDGPIWTRESNALGWASYLENADLTGLPPEAFRPFQIQDFSHFPPVYLDAGTHDVLRDDAVEFGGRLLSARRDVEMHLWRGGFHAFEYFAPDARVSRLAATTRDDWLARLLSH